MKDDDVRKSKTLRALLLMGALIFVFFKTYSIHFNYKYPIHIDEWQHIAQILSAAEGKINWNPYFDMPHRDLEMIFHLFWSFFVVLLGNNSFILLSAYLPAIFAVISSIVLFVFVNKMTNDYYTSLFSILFFASLKSSVNILGINFFSPFTMSIPLFYLFILFFSEGIIEKNLKKLALSIIIWIIGFITYPPLATILILPIAIYLFINRKSLYTILQKLYHTFSHNLFHKFFQRNREVKNKRFVVGMLLTITILAIIMVFLIFKSNINGETNSHGVLHSISKYFIFPLGWTGLEIKYFLPFVFTVPATILALIALYRIFSMPREHAKEVFLAIFVFSTISITALFHNYNFSIFAPYQRVLYYALLGLAPLSAIGLSTVLSYLRKMLKENFRFDELKVKCVSAVFVVIIFIIVFTGRYEPIDSRRMYSEMVVYESDYKALSWLGEHYTNKSVLSPLFMSSAVYPIAKNRVQALLPAQLGTFDRQDERIQDCLNFYEAQNCTIKGEIIKKWNVDLIFSRERIPCAPDSLQNLSLKEIYGLKDFIYEVVY